MDSNLQQQQQQQQMSSGLTRYRSAPSSYLASILSTTPTTTTSTTTTSGGGVVGDDLDHLINTRVSNRRAFPRFTGNPGTVNFAANEQTAAAPNNFTMPSHFGASAAKSQVDIRQQQQRQQQQQQQERSDYAFLSKMYQSQSQAQRAPNLQASTSAMDTSYRLVASANTDRPIQMKNGGLIRHSSSPAGLFDQIKVEYEYGAMRSMSGVGNNANAEASVSSSSWFEKDMDFSSRQPSGLGEITPIPEMEVKGMGDDGPPGRGGGFGESHRDEDNLITSFLDSSSSWEDSAMLSDEFLKGLGDSDRKLFSSVNASDTQNNEAQNRPPTLLSHHLSLPTSSAELAAMEKLSVDTVLCKIRAKRGCATHPRSIAERVRRTRISERMRKLQELVPNMDKQTNTADMLDLAVDYIKDLEKELKALQDNRAKCTCMLK